MIDVETVHIEDWQFWRELRRAALTEAPDAFSSTLADWSGALDTAARWRARISNVGLNLVLRIAGEPVGMVSACSPGADCAIELISLWVFPGARGLGVGDEAIERVLSWAARYHPGSAVQLSVKTLNEPALRLYRRHGFVDAGPSPEDPSERKMRRDVAGGGM